MNTKEFFEVKFASKISENPGILSESGLREKTVAIEIDGNTGGAWTFQFDGSGNISMEAGAEDSAACTISMKDETFEAMLKGKVNVPFAVLTRKIKIRGESAIAAKIGMLLQKIFLKS